MQLLDKGGIKYIFATCAFSVAIYLLIPTIQSQSELFTHIVINHFISLLQKTILFLPVVVFLYNLLPVRKLLDYDRYLSKIHEKLFILLIFMVSFISTNLISYYLYDHIPQGDDIPPFYQAKIFAHAKRWTDPPVYPEFFISEMISHQGKWFSMTPPGHSLILLPGMLLKIPWLICPLLGSLSLIIFYLLLKQLFDTRIAKAGALFLLLSPTFLFISASMLTQNSSYFFLLTSLFLIAKKSQKYSLISGLAAGFAFISRPQISLVFIIAFTIFLIWRKERVKSILFILGVIPFIIGQLIDNYILTGSWRYGYWLHETLNYHAMGFGFGIGAPTFNIPAHTPIKALINLLYNGFVFSLHLFGWPLISLAFVPVIVFKKTKTAWDKLAIGIIVGAIIFWSLYWFHGVSPEGPQYYYEIVPLLILLTVRGIYELKITLRALISLLFLVTLFVYIPLATKIFTLWGTNLNCYNEVKKIGAHHAIVFVRNLDRSSVTSSLPITEIINTINRFNYLSVAFRNAPKIDESDIIYVRDLGEDKNKKLITLYPGREVYLFEYLNIKLTSRFRKINPF